MIDSPAYSLSGVLRWRRILGCSDHIVENLLKIFQPGSRNDNRIAPTTDVLRNAEKTAAWIFLERENEGLSFDLDFICFEGLLSDDRLWANCSRIPV